jgi:hypothetical protein
MTARRRIRTANLIELNQVVSGDHPGVHWVKLPPDILADTPVINRVHPLRDDEEWAMEHFRHKVAQRLTNGAGHADSLSIAACAGKVPRNRAECFYISSVDGIPDGVMADREVTAGLNPGEVNKAFYSVQHWRKLLCDY